MYQPNGRIDLITPPDISNKFALQDRIPVVNKTSEYREALAGMWSDTKLSRAYFSVNNQQIIQNAIRAGVYDKSGGQFVIGEQDFEQLQIVMRGVYLQNAEHRDDDVVGQIARLNKLVVEYCVPQVHGEALGYIKYKYDVSTLPTPLELPEMSNTKHSKQLEITRWF